MKKVITIILVAAIAATSALTLTACGSAKKTADATTAPTTASTQAVTQAATQAGKQSSSQTSDAGAVSSDSGSSSASDGNSAEEYAGLTQQQAIDNVLASYTDDGVQVISIYQGIYPTQHWDAWVVTVQQSDGTTRTFYSGYAFCIPEDGAVSDNSVSNELGVTQDQAVENVEQRIGDFDKITNVEKGTNEEGWDCWVVTVERMDGSVDTYYSGYLFCYPAE